MTYITGFVMAVPTANKEKYTELAKEMAEFVKGMGALDVVDAWGDNVPDGELTSMPKAVQKKDDETIVFSWIVWPDKATSEKSYQEMMKDPRFAADKMPFDGKRVIYGNFTKLQY